MNARSRRAGCPTLLGVLTAKLLKPLLFRADFAVVILGGPAQNRSDPRPGPSSMSALHPFPEAIALLVQRAGPGRAPFAIATLRAIVNKAVTFPDEPKYRRLKAANGKLQQTLLSLEGGDAALLALGFTLAHDDGEAVYILDTPAAAPSHAVEALEAAQASIDATAAAAAAASADGGITDGAASAADDDADPITAAQLVIRWQSGELARKKVVAFYSDKPSAGPLRVFSNFSEHAPWEYTIPKCCGRTKLAEAGRSTTVALTFAEKGIMLCKASVMGCYEMYDEILRANAPASAKKLGRGVYPWDQVREAKHVTPPRPFPRSTAARGPMCGGLLEPPPPWRASAMAHLCVRWRAAPCPLSRSCAGPLGPRRVHGGEDGGALQVCERRRAAPRAPLDGRSAHCRGGQERPQLGHRARADAAGGGDALPMERSQHARLGAHGGAHHPPRRGRPCAEAGAELGR